MPQPSPSISERGRARAHPLLVGLGALTVTATIALAANVAVPAGAAPMHADGAPVSKQSAATTTSASEAPATLRRAALRITVHSTSDWVQVDLPGASAGHVVVSEVGKREVHPTGRGVVVRGKAGAYGAVAVDVVTEVPQSFEKGWIVLSQGAAGAAIATIENRTTDPYQVGSLRTGDGVTKRTETVADDTLMGTTQLEWVRADDERRVLAFTYPWFDERATSDPSLSVHPTDPWEPWSGAEALRSTELARQHGIDGFVMSWSGGAKHGLALYHTLAAANETGGTATILLETVEAATPDRAQQWITEALRQSANPAFLRLDGTPVVFAFDAGVFPKTEWRKISDRLAAAGTPVRIIADVWDGAGGAITGQYRYGALLQAEDDEMTEAELTRWNQQVSRGLRAEATLGHGDPGLVVATAQPGWDDRPLRGDDRLVVDRNDGETYAATWRAALAAEADWVVITSWNEWYEGTGVAPSLEYGTSALAATTEWAQRFGS